MDVDHVTRERRRHVYIPNRSTDHSQVLAGDRYNIDNYKKRTDDDSDTEPEDRGLPKGWDAATLKVFAQDAWRTEILCGEQKLPPTYEDYMYLKGLRANGAPASYTALDPQAFLVMLSSAIWGKNLRHLEESLSTINTERLRDADSVDEMVKIKKELFDNREHLGRLVTQVEHAVTHMPAYLNEYYEAFPTIRHRHKAAYMSPVAHLPEILARASKLDKLILDNFQILMSSVSV